MPGACDEGTIILIADVFYGRDNLPGASSISLLTGRQSLEPSRSTEQYYFDSDLTLSWNVLDFGLSYVRAKQLGDEQLIAEERRRKVINQIIRDVRAAYWRAASAQRLVNELAAVEREAQAAFANSRQLLENGQTAPLAALTYQRELTEILAEAQALELELRVAKTELARLMNLPVGQDFEVILPDRHEAAPDFQMNLREAVSSALQNRPEIREAAYRMRMSEREVTSALLEALPGISVHTGYNYTTNDLLFNSDYLGFGAQASWSLMKVFETPARQRRADAAAELERERAMATAVAISGQVGVSLVRYAGLRDALETARRGQQVQSEIMDQIEAAAEAGQVGEQSLVRERMNKIVAEARYDVAYAEVQEAFADLYAAMGYDPFGQSLSGQEDVQTVAGALSELWTRRTQPKAPDQQASIEIRPRLTAASDRM